MQWLSVCGGKVLSIWNVTYTTLEQKIILLKQKAFSSVRLAIILINLLILAVTWGKIVNLEFKMSNSEGSIHGGIINKHKYMYLGDTAFYESKLWISLSENEYLCSCNCHRFSNL